MKKTGMEERIEGDREKGRERGKKREKEGRREGGNLSRDYSAR